MFTTPLFFQELPFVLQEYVVGGVTGTNGIHVTILALVC